jgi:hypothetical protein
MVDLYFLKYYFGKISLIIFFTYYYNIVILINE